MFCFFILQQIAKNIFQKELSVKITLKLFNDMHKTENNKNFDNKTSQFI